MNWRVLLALWLEVRYDVAMESYDIRLKEPLIIPKELDGNFLFMVDSSLVQLWPQMVRLCEKEKRSLQEVAEHMATNDPLHIGMPEWYFYKLRCLLRAYFLGDEVMTLPVEISHWDGSTSRYIYGESRKLGTTLLQLVRLG